MLVQGKGPLNAKIMIVADYPSKEDIGKGRVLSGADGRLLEEMLSRNGINMSECYVTQASTSTMHEGMNYWHLPANLQKIFVSQGDTVMTGDELVKIEAEESEAEAGSDETGEG